MKAKEVLLRLVVEIMLSDSPIRFSEAVEDAVSLLDEDEVDERVLIAREQRERDEDAWKLG